MAPTKQEAALGKTLNEVHRSKSLSSRLAIIESYLKEWDSDRKKSLIELLRIAIHVEKHGPKIYPTILATLTDILADYKPGSAKTINGHAYVEMGDGLKWATCNVGAAKPEDSGDFFAWGMAETYYSSLDPMTWKDWVAEDGYSYLSNKYFKEVADGFEALKYNGTDGKTILEPEDDAATANWKGPWRMPTEKDWDKLKNTDNFTWTWETKGDVKGYTVTSKVKGYEGNQIFLPVAGSLIAKNLAFKNFRGCYWSSSLVPGQRGNEQIRSYLFKIGESSVVFANEGRYMGCSIRAVSD